MKRTLHVDLPLHEIPPRPTTPDHSLRPGQLYRVIAYDLQLQRLELEHVDTGADPALVEQRQRAAAISAEQHQRAAAAIGAELSRYRCSDCGAQIGPDLRCTPGCAGEAYLPPREA